MTDLTLFREYEPHECGPDGYPRVWHLIPDDILPDGVAALAGQPFGIKDVIRSWAEDRCVRCGHPYRKGQFEFDDRDELHGRRTERDIGVPQAVADLTFDGLIADGVLDVDPKGARRNHWSPCDEGCTHGAPVRVRRGPGEPGPTSAEAGWAYSWPSQEHKAGAIDPRALSARPGGAGQLVAEGYTVQAAWRILTVHHLNGRKHDLRWWNLAALCQRCHLVIQGKVQMARVYPFEHTEWFKPHAAGWYAYAYEGRNITYQEAIDDMDRLLALERLA